MATEIDPKLRSIIRDALGVDDEDVRPEAKLMDDLLADNLDIISMAMAIEREFAIEIDDNLLDGLVTVDDVATLVQKLTTRN